MGKGGTRFVGDALGARSKAITATRNVIREMDEYFETDKYPELQNQIRALGGVAPPLPIYESRRPHVYLDLSTSKHSLGRVVIELFEDEGPLAVNLFKGRCYEGVPETFKGTKIEKVTPALGLFSAEPSVSRNRGLRVTRYPKLCHKEAGAVSIAINGGNSFFISFSACHPMDKTHQVLGRVVEQCLPTLKTMQALRVGVGDRPLHNVYVSGCGFSNARGDDADVESIAPVEKKSVEKQLKEDIAAARVEVIDALQTGIRKKRNLAAQKQQKPKKKGRMYDALSESDISSENEGTE